MKINADPDLLRYSSVLTSHPRIAIETIFLMHQKSLSTQRKSWCQMRSILFLLKKMRESGLTDVSVVKGWNLAFLEYAHGFCRSIPNYLKNEFAI